MDSVNSTTFIKRPPCMTDIQEVLFYTKEVLSGRIFLGLYQERRYVSAINEYRDVIVIHCEETDLQSDLDKVRKKWLHVENIRWVGITGPGEANLPKAYCFWVKQTNLPFGQYWFQIKHVHLKDEQIFLQLKCLRKVNASPSSFIAEVKKGTSKNKNENSEPSTSFDNVNMDFVTEKISAVTKSGSDAVNFILPHITWRNLLTVVRITCALVIAIVMETATCMGKFGEFVLKLIQELTKLVTAVTPIIIHLIDFISKLFGGTFILLAGMFGRNVVRFPPHQTNNIYSAPQPPVAIDWRRRNQKLREELLSSGFMLRE